jgi:two-component system response regulator (stage 0 sporulation protein F)
MNMVAEMSMARVLVVEDDPIIRELIVEVLTDEGHAVIEAADGATGVELAQREKPNLILMDLMLPVMDGVTAIRELKRRPQTQSIRTIAMSAGTNLRLRANDIPADGTLAKPFDIDALLALVVVESRQPGAAPFL